MTGKLRSLYQRLSVGDYLPIFLLIIAVQGTVILSQALAAVIVSPAQLGDIRTFENVFAVLVLTASFGAPTLAMREIAIHQNQSERAQTLRDLILLPVVGTLITILICVGLGVAGFNFFNGTITALAFGIALLITVNLTRLFSAVAQGLQIARVIYLWAFGGALLCATIQTAGAMIGTSIGWIIGRLIGELVLLTTLAISIRGNLRDVAWLEPVATSRLIATMGRATIINLALIVRMMADAAPIVLLNLLVRQQLLQRLHPASELRNDIGYFGLATLTLTIALLPISVMSQREQPILAQVRSSERDNLETEFRHRMLFLSIYVCVPMIVIMIALHFMDIPKISPAMLPAALLFAIIPFKTVMLAQVGILMSHGNYKPILAINIVELAAIIIYMLGIDHSATKWVGVTAIAIGSCISFVGLQFVARHS
jgi:O-antigen/teichoic acid export membrane protein